MSSEWQYLFALNERLRPLRDPVEIQDVGVRLLGEHLHASRVNFTYIDGDEFVINRSYVDGVEPLPARGSVWRFGKALVESCRGGETVAVRDVATDPRLSSEERAQLLASQIAAFVAAPLIKAEHWMATLAVHSASPRAWTRDQIALIEVTAQRTWGIGERVRAEEALGRTESRQAFLRRLNDTIRPLADPARILDETCRLLCTHLRVDRVGYGEIDGDDFVLIGEYAHALPAQPARYRWRTMGNSRAPDVAKGGTMFVNDTATELHTAEERAALQAAGIGAYICPLLVKEGQFLGAFGIHSRLPRVWTPDEIALAQEVADRTWATLEHRKAEAELRANEERLEFLLRLNDALRPLSDAGAVQDTASRLLCEYLATNRAGYAEVEGHDYVIRHEHASGVQGMAGRPASTFSAAARDAYTRGDMMVVNDVAADPRFTDAERAALMERQIAAYAGTPLFKDGQLIAVFGTNAAGPRNWTSTDVTLIRDVGERTWEAVERARAQEALQARREEEHNRELRLLLETATEGILSADATGTIVTANRALETMFGWAPGELIGTPIARLLPNAVLDQGPQHRMDAAGLRKDGSTFPIEVSVNHVATERGGHSIAFVTDITERLRTASALQERSTELEHRTRQLSQMAWELTLAEHHAREQIAKTLHDGLQQLLLISALNIEQALKRANDAGRAAGTPLMDAKHHLEQAIAAARSLHVELFPTVLQRSGLPDALTWLAHWAHEKYGLDVEITAEPHADSTRKDIRTLVFESARELLFNAFKHAHADRVTLALSLSPDDQLCLVVSDNGLGFEPAKLDDRSQAGQVGWGLFSIRERLTLLGGRVDVESAPGRGTQVRLMAPRGATPGMTASAPSSDALRILVVDDHAALRSALRQLLHARPQLSVIGEASNGLEAIAQAQMLRPDVILMDVSMPHMDGIAATARIHAELPGIPVLGLSMQPRSEPIHAIERAGAAGYFVKGLDTDRLIEHLLALHGSRTAAARSER